MPSLNLKCIIRLEGPNSGCCSSIDTGVAPRAEADLKNLTRSCYLLLMPIVLSLSASHPALSLAQVTWTDMIATGDVHMSRQEYPLAEDCYAQALLQVKRHPHDNDELVKCMEKLAAALQVQNKTEDVMPLYKKSLKLLERAHGKESPELVPTLYAMGVIHETEGDLKEAVTTYTRALAINRKSFAPESLNVADSLHRLARAQVAAHLLQPAEALYLESLRIYMHQQSLPSTSGVENLLSDYIDLLKKLELPTRIIASDFQEQLLKDRVGLFNLNMGLPQSFWQKQVSAMLTGERAGSNSAPGRIDNSQNASPQVPAVNTSPPAAQSSAEKKFDTNKVDFYERMVAIDLKALGPNHPTVADDLNALAAVYVAQHRYADAKPLLNRALSIYENVYGPSNLLVTRTRNSLAQVGKRAEHPDLVLSEYHDPSELATISSQAKNLEICLKLNDLAFICYCQGKIDNSVTIYHWALASTSGATGKQSTLTAACLRDFATVLRSTAQVDESRKMLESADTITSNAELSKSILLY